MISRSTLSRSIRQCRVPRAPRRNPTTFQARSNRRGYSSASETASKAKEKAAHGADALKSSDLPWAIPAGVATIAGTYLLLNSGPIKPVNAMPGDEYHGEDDDEEHEGGEEGDEGKEGDEEGEGEEKEDEAEAKDEKEETEAEEGGKEKEQGESEAKAEDEGEQKSAEEDDEQAQGDDNDGAETHSEKPKDKSDDQKTDPSGGSEVKRGEGKNVPGEPKEDKIGKKTKDGEDAKYSETVELDNGDSSSKKIHKPDAKGGAKRRIESSYGNKLGHSGDGDDPDSNSTSGNEAKEGSTYKKQAGLTNTDTKHSIDIGNDPEKSKKAPGVPDTAKSQGTIDPSRPAR